MITTAAWLVSGVALSGVAYYIFVMLMIFYVVFGVFLILISSFASADNLNIDKSKSFGLNAWNEPFWRVPLGRIFVTSFGVFASLGSYFTIYSAGYTTLASWLILLYVILMILSRSVFNRLYNICKELTQ